jgi:hypothetical protein
MSLILCSQRETMLLARFTEARLSNSVRPMLRHRGLLTKLRHRITMEVKTVGEDIQRSFLGLLYCSSAIFESASSGDLHTP